MVTCLNYIFFGYNLASAHIVKEEILRYEKTIKSIVIHRFYDMI